MKVNTLLAKLLYFVAIFSVASNSVAQMKAEHIDRNGEGGLPLKPTRIVEFTTTEGTHMSVDVSPDGKTIVFDLLGDLYLLPIGGGKASPLRRGIEFDTSPRFSPDGEHIAFTSDRSGSSNIWTINADGSGLRQITWETKGRLISPVWSPDGKAVIVFRPWVDRDGFDKPALWKYDVDSGSGSLIPIAGAVRGGAAYDARGQSIFYVGQGDTKSVRSIKMFDIASGQTLSFSIPVGEGGYVTRPLVSPDGKLLAFAAIKHSQTAYPMLSDRSEFLVRSIRENRLEETDLPLGVPNAPVTNSSGIERSHTDRVPGYAFTPDSRSIVFAADGKIQRVDLATKEVTQIPFTADVKAELAALVFHKVPLPDSPLLVKGIHDANESADGKHIVFSALGRIWTMRLTRGAKPKRLTKTPIDDPMVLEYEPSFSPDGKWVAYVHWSHEGRGTIVKVLMGGGHVITLTRDVVPQAYTSLRWAGDGKRLVFFATPVSEFLKGPGTQFGRPRLATNVGWVAADGGPARILPTPPFEADLDWISNRSLTVSSDGREVTWLRRERSGSKLQTAPLDATDISQVRTDAIVDQFAQTVFPSPDRRWGVSLAVAFSGNGFTIHPLPLGQAGAIARIDHDIDDGKGFRVPFSNAFDVRWSPDGKWLTWAWAGRYYRLPWDEAIAKQGKVWPQVTVIDLRVPRSWPTGVILLRGARVITMDPRGVRPVSGPDGTVYETNPMIIEQGDILISGRRIVAVGSSGSLRAPKTARIVNVTGKTIIPGMMHMHGHQRDPTVIPTLFPYSGTDLSFGVTTVRGVGAHDRRQNAREELVESGQVIGARYFGATFTEYPRRNRFINASPEEQIQAAKDMDRSLIKEYSSSDRRWAQKLTMEANRAGLNVAGHNEYSAIFDGNTTMEHGWHVPVSRGARADWRQLAALSGTTLSIHIGLRVNPPELVGDRQRRFPWRVTENQPPMSWESGVASLAKGYRDILRAGGNIVEGGDRHYGGPFVHEFLQSSVRWGEFTPAEALRCVTMNSARALGVADDLGSIEAGKIADLVVLNSNPLDDIANATDVLYVMKDGFMYEGETLDQVWPSEKPYPRYPWIAKPGDTAAPAKPQ